MSIISPDQQNTRKNYELINDPQVAELITKYRGFEGGLVPLLQEAQDVKGYLPREVLEQIAEGLHTSLAKVYGVATFYSQFHLKPRGKNIIRVCQGTACHVRGGTEIMASLEKELGIGANETTLDQSFTLESVACIGACGLAPVITVNDNTHGRLTTDKVSELLQQYQSEQNQQTQEGSQ
ncbi:MAG: NADH-quinone oxidoreductase subunit NuoE [Carboxydocellales bacterium]